MTNGGWAASAATIVSLYEGNPTAGGTLLASATVPALAIGGSVEVALPWTPATGDHDLWLVVDSTDVVAESDETNNTHEEQVSVLEPPTLVLVSCVGHRHPW